MSYNLICFKTEHEQIVSVKSHDRGEQFGEYATVHGMVFRIRDSAGGFFHLFQEGLVSLYDSGQRGRLVLHISLRVNGTRLSFSAHS